MNLYPASLCFALLTFAATSVMRHPLFVSSIALVVLPCDLWAAEKLGKDGQAADDYAKSVLLSDLEIPGDDDIIAKLHSDLAGLGVGVNDIKAMLAEKLAQAEAQISGVA